jgi:Rrf2 family protein
LFSQTAEYALRTIVWLATQDGAPKTNHQIAEATKVPEGYLSKILQMLGRAGLVSSQRGMNGGFTLTPSPEDLTLLDVVNAVDPIKRITKCPLGLESHDNELCPVHHRLDSAIAEIERLLGDATIAELIVEKSPSNPFCG